jgi:hypothetical protein
MYMYEQALRVCPLCLLHAHRYANEHEESDPRFKRSCLHRFSEALDGLTILKLEVSFSAAQTLDSLQAMRARAAHSYSYSVYACIATPLALYVLYSAIRHHKTVARTLLCCSGVHW